MEKRVYDFFEDKCRQRTLFPKRKTFKKKKKKKTNYYCLGGGVGIQIHPFVVEPLKIKRVSSFISE